MQIRRSAICRRWYSSLLLPLFPRLASWTAATRHPEAWLPKAGGSLFQRGASGTSARASLPGFSSCKPLASSSDLSMMEGPRTRFMN